MKKIIMVFTLLIGLSSVAGCAEVVVIKGRIAIAGSAPNTYVRVLTETNTEYRLVGPEADQIRNNWQGQQVVLEGRIIKPAVGPGFPAELEVDRIVDQE